MNCNKLTQDLNKLSRPFSLCHEWISERELICVTHYSHFHFRKWPISTDAVRVWRTQRGPKPRGKADVTVPMEVQTSNYCGASGKLIPAGSFVCWCKSIQSFRSFSKTGEKSLLIKTWMSLLLPLSLKIWVCTCRMCSSSCSRIIIKQQIFMPSASLSCRIHQWRIYQSMLYTVSFDTL